MEKSCDRLSPFVCWLGGLGCVPGEFTYFCRIEKYLIAGTAFLRAPLACLLAGFSNPVSYSVISSLWRLLFFSRYRCSGLPWEIEAAIALTSYIATTLACFCTGFIIAQFLVSKLVSTYPVPQLFRLLCVLRTHTLASQLKYHLHLRAVS